MTTTTTAADYVWFRDSYPELGQAYCFTLVHGLPPAEVLRRLGGREEAPRTGVEEVVEAAFDHLERVSHFVNINGVGSFLWAEDGTNRLTFEPGFPDSRWGTSPDELLEPMRHLGFQFWEETSDTAENLAAEAAFAPAEHLTGVRVTPELLQETTFTCGSAKIE
ncbi:DUF6461 domain-containing protein [Streptomyces sp. NPDC059092]|uniref:DUF6461 domain-containing protein n=1 Tax=Streptomyces sp. NPDC059092 TaxID=3346725 RepID=UPI0036B5E680